MQWYVKTLSRYLWGVPELSEHVFFHNYQYCANTTEDVDANIL